MAKRLTDVNKWDKLWFRKLTPLYKCFWMYLVDRCNYAGIWEVDFETAQHYLGEQLDPDTAAHLFCEHYIILASGKKWFIKDFIGFQYGTLSESNKMYRSVVSLLESESFDYTPFMGHISPIYGGKDKDKDKVKDKDMVIVKVKERIVKENKPTLQEVLDYIKERGLNVDGEHFFNHYELIGWVYGKHKTPIKNWHLALSTWMKNDEKYKKKDGMNVVKPEPNKYKNEN